MRESTVEQALVARVRALGGVAYKFTSPGRRSVPDRLVLLPEGRAVFVELKAPNKKPTEAQARTHEYLRALGFRVEVIDDAEEARAWAP